MHDLPAGYDFRTYERWFLDFTQGYLQGSDFDTANIRIKINHTLRVLGFARQITKNLDLTPVLQEMAHLAALFHDIGRFPQYARYKTYNDKVSVNHATEGVRTMKQHGVLAGFPPQSQHLILGAIALHNRRFLPNQLPVKVRLLTQIVRDADKLDIFAVMLAHFDPRIPYNKVVNLELKPDPDNYTPAILEKVQARQSVNYQHLTWVNDFKLMLCSWLYDLNYPVSQGLAREKGYLDKLLDYLPKTPEFEHLGRQLRQTLQDALDR
ncbi:MAG TPA: HD family phosphohydrolase [Desulfobacterales bacterium]|nr:HD family phosphohydrolase [Desulfobacterales bacterium]